MTLSTEDVATEDKDEYPHSDRYRYRESPPRRSPDRRTWSPPQRESLYEQRRSDYSRFDHSVRPPHLSRQDEYIDYRRRDQYEFQGYRSSQIVPDKPEKLSKTQRRKRNVQRTIDRLRNNSSNQSTNITGAYQSQRQNAIISNEFDDLKSKMTTLTNFCETLLEYVKPKLEGSLIPSVPSNNRRSTTRDTSRRERSRSKSISRSKSPDRDTDRHSYMAKFESSIDYEEITMTLLGILFRILGEHSHREEASENVTTTMDSPFHTEDGTSDMIMPILDGDEEFQTE